MFKRLLNLGLLGLVILLAFQGPTYAKPDSNNPFASFDKEYEERLSGIKEESDESVGVLDKQARYSLKSSGKTYIVKFKDKSSMEEIFNIVSLYDYKILGKSDNRLFVLELTDLEDFKAQSKDIIEFIEENAKREANIVPSDPYYKDQWALPAIKTPQAWGISKGSNSVYVAVIDSGVYRQHPDLVNADIRNGWDYIFEGYCNWDATGHGTNVTGIIGAKTNNSRGIAGVNWNVAIIPLRVIGSNGKGDVSDTIQAIYDAAYLESDVINISLGGPSDSLGEELAISYAISQGSIVVAAAGNDGSDEYQYPASYDGVVSVGSVGPDLKYSDFTQYNDAIDLVAPGEDIFTTIDRTKDPYNRDYAYVDGTSFAAPHVSGIAGLMSAVKPSISADEFMEAIKLTSTDLGAPGYDKYYGYGLINAEKMLESVSNIPSNTIEWDLFEDISLDKSWSIKFNMVLDETSLKDNVYMLDRNNEEFPISVSMSDDSKGLIVSPLRNYDYNSNYTIVVDNKVISETGVKLKNKVYIPFITVAGP